MNVAILLYEGVYQLDFAGPMEVFADAGLDEETPAFTVYTVAESTSPLHTHTGLRVRATYSFATRPPRISWWSRVGNSAWGPQHPEAAPSGCVRRLHAHRWSCRCARGPSSWRTSVCWTDWRQPPGTERWIACRPLRPSAFVRGDVRYTDNGHVVTTAGNLGRDRWSAARVARLHGADMARRTARYMDYEYRTDGASEN